MTQHLTVDALADLLVGEGDAAAVAHLESCADCAGRLSELADAVEATDPLLAALAASPVPALPDGFEERLAERLEQEAREQAQHRPQPRSGSGLVALPGGDDEHDDEHRAGRQAAVVPLQPRRGRPRGAGLLGVAAGATGLLVAGALGLSLLGGGGPTSGGGSESTSGAVAAPESADQGTAGAESTDQAAGGAAGGAAATEGAAGGAAAAGAAPRSMTDVQAASGAVVQSSGVDYRPEAAHVQDLLPGLLAGDYSGIDAAQPAPVAAAAEAQQAQDGTSPTTGPADPLARLREPAALQECLEALADGSAGADPEAAPLALDYTTSQGAPALVVALPAPGGLVDVSAVGPGCAAGDPQRLWSFRVRG